MARRERLQTGMAAVFAGLRRATEIVTALGALTVLTGTVANCRVEDGDVKRWETTERGPYKLVAVITHEKYAWDLRSEAALSLIRMPPRGGVRQGIKFLIDKYKDEDGVDREGALTQLPDEARRQIVDRLAPAIEKELEPAPPKRAPDGRLPPDPSIPYKDAAFAMLTHEPPLVSNEKTRSDLRTSLVHWSQTGFEDRVENGAQQYGLEQMMRFLGPDSVRGLPDIINENTTRLDRVASLVADIGDDATKARATAALVALANHYHDKSWTDAQTAIVKDYNAKNKTTASDSQVAGQVDKILERRLTEEVFPAMKRVGGRAALDYLFAYASDPQKPAERRKLALAALEGKVDKNNKGDLERLVAIAGDDQAPPDVRTVAFARMGEFPKDQILPRLYPMFDGKKWHVRWTAASLVLKTLTPKQIPEFMGHLPKTAASKMGMTEPLSYGDLIAKMDVPPGEPTPREAILPFLAGKDLGPKLTALGFFWEGKKADQSVVSPYADDPSPLPRCEKDDDCAWTCDVTKAGEPAAAGGGAAPAESKEPKELKTVGDFVKYCLVPSMEK